MSLIPVPLRRVRLERVGAYGGRGHCKCHGFSSGVEFSLNSSGPLLAIWRRVDPLQARQPRQCYQQQKFLRFTRNPQRDTGNDTRKLYFPSDHSTARYPRASSLARPLLIDARKSPAGRFGNHFILRFPKLLRTSMFRRTTPISAQAGISQCDAFEANRAASLASSGSKTFGRSRHPSIKFSCNRRVSPSEYRAGEALLNSWEIGSMGKHPGRYRNQICAAPSAREGPLGSLRAAQ